MPCEASLKQLTALFVEDEESLLTLLVSALGKKFKHYTTATNGLEGIEKAKEVHPDIIISDITMPHMDGLTMAERIHADTPDLPIVILSAYSDKEKLLGAIDAGIAKYFIKPFDPDELLSYLCILAEKHYRPEKAKLIPPYYFDEANHTLLREGRVVRLTPRELDLISYLIKAPNHIISKEEISERIGKETKASDESVRVFIRRLREKTDRDFIQNLPKQGYVLGLA